MYIIFKKEIKYFFSSIVGYIVIGTFVLATALLLWILPGQYNIIESGYANLNGLFMLAPWLFLFLCPAICMRLFAEEKQSGTIDLLLTKPINRWMIVLGKFLAGWTLVIIALIPSIFSYISVYHLSQGAIDAGEFWGSFFGLTMLAAIYTSIGLFASSISKNQIVAFILAIVISFVMFYGFELICSLLDSGEVSYYIQQLGISSHYKAVSRGVIDSRDMIYFISSSAMFIWLTKITVQK